MRGTHTLINLDNVLPNDSACTDVQVAKVSTSMPIPFEKRHSPNLRVTHKTLLESDSQTMGF